jgi:glycosyltransferase involved in cell wall biosynthesis
MFILVQPAYSKRELNGDSIYVVYSSLIRAMRRVRPDYHFVVLFPDATSDFRYDDDGFFNAANVSRIPMRIAQRKMAASVAFDAGWYDRMMRQYAFDVIWCHLVEIAGQLKMAGEGVFYASARPSVIAAHNYVIHRSLPYPFEAQSTTAFAQVMGAVLADHNVFNSEHCRTMLAETAREWLKPEVVERIMRNSTQINHGTLESDLVVDAERPANPVPVIIYNHRLQAYKNWTTTFDLFASLWDEGLRFKVRYTSSNAEKLSKISSYPFVDVRLCATRPEYLAALRGGDFNVMNSQHETFCISAVESMALGQPLIAPDGVTFPEITGRRELQYPYLFKDLDQQKMMVRRFIVDPAERIRWGKRLAAFVRREFNQQLWAERYAALFDAQADVAVGTVEDSLEFIGEMTRKCDGLTLADFLRETRHKQVNGRMPFAAQSLTTTRALRLIAKVGGRVVMRNGSQTVIAPGSAIEPEGRRRSASKRRRAPARTPQNS